MFTVIQIFIVVKHIITNIVVNCANLIIIRGLRRKRKLRKQSLDSTIQLLLLLCRSIISNTVFQIQIIIVRIVSDRGNQTIAAQIPAEIIALGRLRRMSQSRINHTVRNRSQGIFRSIEIGNGNLIIEHNVILSLHHRFFQRFNKLADICAIDCVRRSFRLRNLKITEIRIFFRFLKLLYSRC